MRLEDYLQPDFVIGELVSESKPDVLAELIAPMKARWPDFDDVRARQVLLDRENLGTTGIGDGVAIPHGKMENLEQIVIVVGRSLKGVNFDALDFKPCRIFFLVLAPEHVAGLHLRILAHISRLLSDESFRHAFMSAENDAALWQVLTAAA
ncbi:PTS sugar transporter subunit IIA [Desulfovibrio sp. JY]|uniref:Putative PTS IIA-like nitrogen-regulatory protein PtsN n=1 Tax=Solidesulfovibrio fructosivorans JJ] TaxID=596151 RepID=E1JQX6_SOLFR|nr:PTS sugar transporter subunit IIA [Solidesulfovibrio fructosivorans]EFL52977.1 putative PTS IIA-like nitrogen-regulatory protein PtsN [Solidesulfovibrio fructosivorans JJ]]UJX40412.1 PTS sugar transporter subunit IIA [Desulfovibrio sp. JY]